MGKYLVTGGTGFIGTALSTALTAEGHEQMILTRRPEKHRGRFPATVSLIDSLELIPAEEKIDGIINLAGEGIADRRWSEKRKQVLFQSRIGVTEQVVTLVDRLETKPAVMISGSAVGYYGAQEDAELTEESQPSPEFTHELCREWESSAEPVTSAGVRLCLLRLGLVLGRGGGLLKRLLPPFYLGLGGRIGDGSQMMSWIHLQDVVGTILFLLENTGARGVYNLSAPNPVSNAEFTRQLARTLRRPAVFPMPAFVVRTVFGEMGDRLLLHGQKVVPLRLNRAGYIFKFETLEEALQDILKGSSE